MKTYLITGGAGFIGSNFIRYILQTEENIRLINLDKLTYSGNLENLKDIEKDGRYKFIRGDIADRVLITEVFTQERPDIIINFAAETHVDRSIGNPDDFIRTDIYGAYTLLETLKEKGAGLFIQISTDEVYGECLEGFASEEYPLKPSNPYSASKAGADRLCYAYWRTYGLPIIITRASNNYGPYQYPEKLISLFITNALQHEPLPVYGDGNQIRDWLYVLDNCRAIRFIIEHGDVGETYNIGSGNLIPNIQLTRMILQILDKPEDLIKYVPDRPGHDRRYAMDYTKIKSLGWNPEVKLEDGLKQTIDWYIENKEWWQKLKSSEFLEYYKRQYPTLNRNHK